MQRQPMNILVVDDSRSIRQIISAYINDLGFTAVEAIDGEDGLAKFQKQNINLVLMDIEMPGISGYEVTRRLRKSLADKWLPIIFLSSNKSDDHFVEGINAGGDAYLFKPVNGPVLQSMVSAMARIAAMQEKLEDVNRRLEEIAYLDPLTGLHNRRSMLHSLDREWGRAKRNGKPLSVVIIDADHFKAYNDYYGHVAGDKCLLEVAEAIKVNTLRPGDMGFRYGGEEFFVLLPETDLPGAVHVAERIRQALEERNIPHEKSSHGRMTISLGVATKTDQKSSEEFIKSADSLLYKAKENNRNCVIYE